MTQRPSMDSNRIADSPFAHVGVATLGFAMLLTQGPLPAYAGDSPVKLPLTSSPGAVMRVTKIAAGGSHNLLIAEDGTV